MSRSFVSPPRLLLAWAITAAMPVSAQSLIYERFELQARSNLLVNDNGFNLPPGSSFNSITPTLNDDGWVAFPVQVVTHEGNPALSGVGVWHGKNAVGGIVHRHDGDNLISPEIAINATGDVAYRLWPEVGNDQLWLFDPALGSVSQVPLLPLTPSRISSLSLSDDRVVGYQATFGTGRGLASTAAFASPPDSRVHAYETALDPGSPYSYLYSPAMNNQRVIAGKVHVQANAQMQQIRLFRADGSSDLVAESSALAPGSPFVAFDNGLAVNDHGVVAVIVRRAADNARAVYRLAPGDSPVEIARVGVDGITEIQSFRPAINNLGQVVFRASDAQGQAVYVHDGGELVRVIGRGDTIITDRGLGQIGQHDSSPVFGGAPGFNNFGDVVVAAGLHPEGNNQIEWGSGIIVAWAWRGDPLPKMELDLAPKAFQFNVVIGAQADDVLTIGNFGMGLMAWEIDMSASCAAGASAHWLMVGGEGALGTGETATVDVMVDASRLTEGSHETAFCVDAHDDEGGPYQASVTVPVTLVVKPDLSDDCVFQSGFEETGIACNLPE